MLPDAPGEGVQNNLAEIFYDKQTQRMSTKYDKGKGKVFPYSLPSVGPGADPGVQAVSPQVT